MFSLIHSPWKKQSAIHREEQWHAHHTQHGNGGYNEAAGIESRIKLVVENHHKKHGYRFDNVVPDYSSFHGPNQSYESESYAHHIAQYMVHEPLS